MQTAGVTIAGYFCVFDLYLNQIYWSNTNTSSTLSKLHCQSNLCVRARFIGSVRSVSVPACCR